MRQRPRVAKLDRPFAKPLPPGKTLVGIPLTRTQAGYTTVNSLWLAARTSESSATLSSQRTGEHHHSLIAPTVATVMIGLGQPDVLPSSQSRSSDII